MLNLRLILVLLVMLEVIIFSSDKSSIIEKQDTKILSPLAAPAPKINSQKINTFFYPGSNLISNRENYYVLVANDDVQKIIDWYRDVLSDQKDSNRSFSETIDNGMTKSKITSVFDNKTILISINKQPEDKKTIIGLAVED